MKIDKYKHNVFDAYEVTYFKACREYCEQMGGDWRKVILVCSFLATSTTRTHTSPALMASSVMEASASRKMLMHSQR